MVYACCTAGGQTDWRVCTQASSLIIDPMMCDMWGFDFVYITYTFLVPEHAETMQ